VIAFAFRGLRVGRATLAGFVGAGAAAAATSAGVTGASAFPLTGATTSLFEGSSTDSTTLVETPASTLVGPETGAAAGSVAAAAPAVASDALATSASTSRFWSSSETEANIGVSTASAVFRPRRSVGAFDAMMASRRADSPLRPTGLLLFDRVGRPRLEVVWSFI
jgi:hypothetical protein